MSRKDFVVLSVLVLGVVLGVQYIQYWVHVDGVRKSVADLFIVYQMRGVDAYVNELVDELELMGMELDRDALVVTEDHDRDIMSVELRYTWPLRLLHTTTQRRQVVRDATPVLRL